MTKSKAYQIRLIMDLQGKDVDDEDNQEECEHLEKLSLNELLIMISDLRKDFSTSFNILK